MTAIAALTLADGQATPANHTFSPVNIDGTGLAKWADRSGGISVGFPTITFSLRKPSKASRNYKVFAKVTVPTLEQTSTSTTTGIAPPPTKAFDLIANIEFVMHERSSAAQRADLIAYAKNLLANAAVIPPAVNAYEEVY